jgi:hypothetical protein
MSESLAPAFELVVTFRVLVAATGTCLPRGLYRQMERDQARLVNVAQPRRTRRSRAAMLARAAPHASGGAGLGEPLPRAIGFHTSASGGNVPSGGVLGLDAVGRVALERWTEFALSVLPARYVPGLLSSPG